MGPGKLFWKLFLGNAVLMVAAMAVLLWFLVGALDRTQSRELTEHLKAQALIIRQAIADKFSAAHAAELDRFVKTLGASQPNRPRYTLILANGTVVADSEADPAAMETHAARAEVRRALADGWGEDTHVSHTLAYDTRYVAVRVGTVQAPSGVVRVAMPVRTIVDQTRATHRFIWTIGGAGLLAVVFLALGLARLWSQPIRRITLTARSLSRGDLSARVPVTGSDELALLARSLNQMRDRLNAHLDTIDRQRRTLESLLSQLDEGVIVAGPDGRIILINPTAVRLLGLSASQDGPTETFEGRTVEQCVAQHELQRMLLAAQPAARTVPETGQSCDAPDSREARLQVQGPDGPLVLLARVSDVALPVSTDAPGGHHEADRSVMGRLLVLTDVTELTRTIQVKTDFAANASHELRTPLSAIRVAVETLMQMDSAREPDAARHFLSVIDRQSERMQAMVGDLLDLSRLESSTRQFEPAPVNLREFFQDLFERFETALNSKGLLWEIELPENAATVTANTYLLRLVLDNLVDNAVKFTDAGGRIRVRCRKAQAESGVPGRLSIEVNDTGCGIPEAEQARVFERFYQVERARSGSLRGTGLGLSIVRHAVAAMRGTVSLQSQVGQGTCVTIVIPQ